MRYDALLAPYLLTLPFGVYARISIRDGEVIEHARSASMRELYRGICVDQKVVHRPRPLPGSDAQGE